MTKHLPAFVGLFLCVFLGWYGGLGCGLSQEGGEPAKETSPTEQTTTPDAQAPGTEPPSEPFVAPPERRPLPEPPVLPDRPSLPEQSALPEQQSEPVPELPIERAPTPDRAPPPPTGCPPGVNGLNHGSGTIFGCAILADGRAACMLKSSTKGKMYVMTYKDGTPVKQVKQATGWGFTEEACILLASGAVHCGRIDPNGNAGVGKTPVLAKDVIAISGGYEEMCALVRQAGGTPNKVMCWTKNHGADNLSTTPKAIQLEANDRPIAISSRYQGNCVLLEGGRIKCWGSNSDGQLGRGNSAGDTTKPAATKPLAGAAIYLAAGQSHTCVVLQGGSLQCWGATWAGQIGLPPGAPVNAPGKLAFSKGVKAVATGQFHTCVLLTTGEVQCSGKIGSSTQWQGWKRITGIKDAVAISAGKEYSCVLHQKGQVSCWGNPSGNATPVTATLNGTPIQAKAPTCTP